MSQHAAGAFVLWALQPALRLCCYQMDDKMLTKETLEGKRETAGAILAMQQWRCHTVILSPCQKPQYGQLKLHCVWLIC